MFSDDLVEWIRAAASIEKMILTPDGHGSMSLKHFKEMFLI